MYTLPKRNIQMSGGRANYVILGEGGVCLETGLLTQIGVKLATQLSITLNSDPPAYVWA